MLRLCVSLCLAWIGPEPLVIRESFDQIEVNHFYDERGQHVLDQLIFRAWRGSALEIVDWRLLKNDAMQPRGRRVVWVEPCGEQLVLRDVRGKSVIETWTQLDPEVIERDLLPKEQRRGLAPAHIPKVTK
jgi:hypothetical protein